MPAPLNYRGLLDVAAIEDVAPMPDPIATAMLNLVTAETQLKHCGREEGETLLNKIGKAEQMAAEKSFVYRTFAERLNQYEVLTTGPLRLFVSFLGRSHSDAVLWAHALAQLRKERGWITLSFADFVEAFPVGFPTEPSIRKAWQLQKMGTDRDPHCDNWLDKPEFWPFIPKITP